MVHVVHAARTPRSKARAAHKYAQRAYKREAMGWPSYAFGSEGALRTPFDLWRRSIRQMHIFTELKSAFRPKFYEQFLEDLFFTETVTGWYSLYMNAHNGLSTNVYRVALDIGHRK